MGEPGIHHRSNIPAQSVAEILKNRKSSSPVLVRQTDRVHIPKQTLSEILKIPYSPKTSTEDPIAKLNSILRQSKQHQESEILSILGLKSKPKISDRKPYMESETTHKRSLTPNYGNSQIENQYSGSNEYDTQEKQGLKTLGKDQVPALSYEPPQGQQVSQEQTSPVEYIEDVQQLSSHNNRDKVFSILSSTAKHEAIFGISLDPIEEKPNVEIEYFPTDTDSTIVHMQAAKNTPIEVYSSENHKWQNDPEKREELQSNFQFIPNLENDAVAQLLNLPKDSNSQIQITLENLENIVKHSRHKDRSEVVGILGFPPVSKPIMRLTEAGAFPGTPAGNAGFPGENQTGQVEEFLNQKDLLEQFVKKYESEQMKEPYQKTHDRPQLFLDSGVDDQLHVELLTQLPPEILVKLEAEVPSLSSMISLAKVKQETLNQNIGFR